MHRYRCTSSVCNFIYLYFGKEGGNKSRIRRAPAGNTDHDGSNVRKISYLFFRELSHSELENDLAVAMAVQSQHLGLEALTSSLQLQKRV